MIFCSSVLVVLSRTLSAYKNAAIKDFRYKYIYAGRILVQVGYDQQVANSLYIHKRNLICQLFMAPGHILSDILRHQYIQHLT